MPLLVVIIVGGLIYYFYSREQKKERIHTLWEMESAGLFEEGKLDPPRREELLREKVRLEKEVGDEALNDTIREFAGELLKPVDPKKKSSGNG